ncbi:MAG: ABC transporter permease [Nitrososphaerota archaeon]
MKLISTNTMLYQFRKYKLQISIGGIALLLWMSFLLINPQLFLSSYTYSALMSVIPITIILSLSLTFIIACGEIDLSFPSVMAFSSWVFSIIWTTTQNDILALLGCLFSGGLIGLINGLLIVKMRIPSFLATIGTMFFWRGVVMVITEGWTTSLAGTKGKIVHTFLVGRIPIIKEGIPAQMVWSVILAIICWILLNKHIYGAHVLLIGDNIEAARMMGVPTDKIKLLVFTHMGLFASFAGIISSLEILTFWPTMGEIHLLLAIAAVIIGGTPFTGGIGSIFGSFIGACILGTIETGILGIGLTGFWVRLLYGFIIIISLMFQVILRKPKK